MWSRLFLGENKTNGYVNDVIPELAAAVLPTYIGKGVGTMLLQTYLEHAQTKFPAVALNVRADNPAFGCISAWVSRSLEKSQIA